jgi:hypothetical protein
MHRFILFLIGRVPYIVNIDSFISRLNRTWVSAKRSSNGMKLQQTTKKFAKKK